MTSPPRFSILLPTHNRADVLPIAIHSVLWQTERDFELLILGDGCTDDTAQRVAAFDDPRIRWFDLPKAPCIGYANRNVGLRHARGRYIAYHQHDDIWFPDHLARIGARLDESGADLAYSRCLWVDHLNYILPSAFDIGVPSHAAGLRHGDMAMTLSSVAHTRACVERHGGWDDTLLRAGDVEFYHRIGAGGGMANITFLSEPTSLHFVSTWRATRQFKLRKRVAWSLLHGLYDRDLPPALHLSVAPGESPQHAAWRRLAANPAEEVAAIRLAVVQFHDALLWRGRSTARMIGLRAGHAVGDVLEAMWQAVLWGTSAKRRQWQRALRQRAAALDDRRRTTANPPSTAALNSPEA
jgi:glycosyltransferase involved in cell wall biosynthesis